MNSALHNLLFLLINVWSKILNKICPEYAKDYWQKLRRAMNTDNNIQYCTNYNLSIPYL